MPELDAEHRDQMAEAIHARYGLSHCPHWGNGSLCKREADALAPLVAGWIADAWDAGWDSRHESVWEENPYRGGDDG